MDFTTEWSEKTEIPAARFISWIGVQRGKFYAWALRYGKVNEHNGRIPRDHWLTPAEKQAILDFHERHPLDGYRRLTFMMIDQDIVAASPSTVHRVLRAAGRLDRWNRSPSKKGTGFEQPLQPHEHWHIDISYINIAGTFYYLCSILDGCSRFLVHWELRECMKEADVERVIERAREAYPGLKPRVTSDNGPQFIAGDFKKYIRLTGMTHVRTAPYYPQSNGKIERWHKTLKTDAIRPKVPATIGDAIRVVTAFVLDYKCASYYFTSVCYWNYKGELLADWSCDRWPALQTPLEVLPEPARVEVDMVEDPRAVRKGVQRLEFSVLDDSAKCLGRNGEAGGGLCQIRPTLRLLAGR